MRDGSIVLVHYLAVIMYVCALKMALCIMCELITLCCFHSGLYVIVPAQESIVNCRRVNCQRIVGAA